MRLDASTVFGFLAGLVLFLATALTGVIAVNGAENPGVGRERISAAAGATGGEEVGPEPPAPRSFAALDADGDGGLSLAEAAGHADIVARFERADRNRDGRLSRAELERLAKLRPPRAPKPVSREMMRRDAAAGGAGG